MGFHHVGQAGLELLTLESLSVSQTGVPWRNLGSLKPPLRLPGSSNSTASASIVAEIIGMCHHTWHSRICTHFSETPGLAKKPGKGPTQIINSIPRFQDAINREMQHQFNSTVFWGKNKQKACHSNEVLHHGKKHFGFRNDKAWEYC
ncbi:hypothetical protein AAY473_012499 [Plecturocebus cupreus]